MRVNHLLSLETLFRVTHDLHKAHKRIGITHGAFDLFHASHLDLLKKSAALCDFLIVGVDSDKNVATYKSYKRPIIKQQDRINIINELHCVDAVYLNDLDLKPEAFTDLYKELHVDTVTIGKRFGFAEVIEMQTKNANAQLVKLKVKDFTTTKIINEVIKRYKT